LQSLQSADDRPGSSGEASYDGPTLVQRWVHVKSILARGDRCRAHPCGADTVVCAGFGFCASNLDRSVPSLASITRGTGWMPWNGARSPRDDYLLENRCQVIVYGRSSGDVSFLHGTACLACIVGATQQFSGRGEADIGGSRRNNGTHPRQHYYLACTERRASLANG
jgi:hypothetical protein